MQFKDILKYGAGLLIAGVIVWALSSWYKSCKVEKLAELPIRVASQSVVSSLETKLQIDTVVKFIERIKYKEVPAQIIYEQKVDSVQIEKYRDHDLAIEVDKDGDMLTIYVVNEAGQTMKKKVYHNIGNDFTATSVANGTFVKSKLWYWEGLRFRASYNFGNVDSLDYNWSPDKLQLGVRTGISYMDKLSLSPVLSITPGTSLSPKLSLELEYKLK